MDRINSSLVISSIVCTAVALFAPQTSYAADSRRPNVVLIMTDDQGWGDLRFHGNKHINTPHLDALARQSVVLKNFYVSPVCAPTRASLMTGRYNYRTGAIDTYRGRAMMHGDEVTIAELLSAAGYRTGIFGKWHLGDNYPLRAQDQGFQESLTLWGGGLVQWADPPAADGNSYINPWLSHNGDEKRFEGYCSDIYTDAAIDYIARHQADPFFVYLAFNCPHTPLQVRDEDVAPYMKGGLSEIEVNVYGMVSNIDSNVGKLLKKLDELSLTENTIVIFMTDNGPQQRRYNGKWRGLKGSVYEGGIHVPFFIRWPARLKAGHTVDQVAAHIDVLPTLLAACGVTPGEGVKLDGRNLLPLLAEEPVDWPERLLFFQWHRGDVPELHRAFAVRGPRFKLVQATGTGEQKPPSPRFELFDLAADPGEQHDLSAQEPDLLAQMKAAYEAWFRDVSASRGYEPPRIQIGTTHENPVRLSRQDLRGFGPTEPGYWRTEVKPGRYDLRVLLGKRPANASVKLALENRVLEQAVEGDSQEVVFRQIDIAGGPGDISAWIAHPDGIAPIPYVILKRRDSATLQQD